MNRTQQRVMIGIGGFTALALTCAAGYSMWHVNQNAKQNQQALTEIFAQVQHLQSSESTSMSGEELEEAIQQAIASRATAERQDAIDQRYAEFTAAPESADDGKWIYGEPDARFTLIEFADTECGYCKQFHDTPKALVDQSNGMVNWQFEHLAILGPTSVNQAHSLECLGDQVGNRGFWVSLSEVYKQTRSGGQGIDDIQKLVSDVGADFNEYKSCMSSGRYYDDIESTKQAANARGITGTPATLILDNKTGSTQLARGAKPAQAIASTIRSMIAQANEIDQTKEG